MYSKFVWWLYGVVYGTNETIDREDGDEQLYQRIYGRYQKQRSQWAKFWRVYTI